MTESNETPGSLAKFLPTINHYMKDYASPLSDNDQKAVRMYKEYESPESVRRLQNELLTVKNSMATETACKVSIGAKRAGQYRSYEQWATMMLMWLAAIKK